MEKKNTKKRLKNMKEKKELVSIIIPTYKTNESLKRAIDSVLNQSYENVEIIVVDDNHNDEYREKAASIIREYSDNRIIYVQHEKNKNGSAARNTGVSNCHGKYIGFLDDDDYFLPNKIEKQYNFINNNNYQFCTCFYYRNNHKYSFKIKDDYSIDVFLNKTTPQTSSFFMKRSFYNELNGFNESYIRHQDYEFLLRVCEKEKVGVVPESLYVMDTNGVNNIPNGKKIEEIKNKLLKEFDGIIEKNSFNKKKIYGNNYAQVGFAYFKGKNFKEFIRISKEYFGFYYISYLLLRFLKSLLFRIKR